MTTEIILQKTMRLIAAASADSRVGELSRLTRIAERVAEIQRTHKKLEAELHALAAELERSDAQTSRHDSPRTVAPDTSAVVPSSSSNGHPHLLGPLAVEIDWAAASMPYPKQIICERKASDTLRVLAETILARFGEATMEKLAILRVNRAPPLSRRPEVDFINRKRGVPYQHQRVGRSAWHVLTHSATSEKIDFVHQLAHALRFPPGAMTAREIDVQQEIDKLLA